jgi:hypothetical protein
MRATARPTLPRSSSSSAFNAPASPRAAAKLREGSDELAGDRRDPGDGLLDGAEEGRQRLGHRRAVDLAGDVRLQHTQVSRHEVHLAEA